MARKKVEDAEYLSNAEAVKKSKKKYMGAGFMEIKVRVAKNAPEEADAVRKYAARKPKTKALYEKMKGE